MCNCVSAYSKLLIPHTVRRSSWTAAVTLSQNILHTSIYWYGHILTLFQSQWFRVTCGLEIPQFLGVIAHAHHPVTKSYRHSWCEYTWVQFPACVSDQLGAWGWVTRWLTRSRRFIKAIYWYYSSSLQETGTPQRKDDMTAQFVGIRRRQSVDRLWCLLISELVGGLESKDCSKLSHETQHLGPKGYTKAMCFLELQGGFFIFHFDDNSVASINLL